MKSENYTAISRRSFAAVEKSAGQVVLSFIKALNEENFDLAQTFVKKDLRFDGVMGSRHNAEEYFKDMKSMRFKYVVKKTFEDGDDVCLFYDIKMSGKNLFCSGWYHLEDGKISNFKVIFDPRPLLDQTSKAN